MHHTRFLTVALLLAAAACTSPGSDSPAGMEDTSDVTSATSREAGDASAASSDAMERVIAQGRFVDKGGQKTSGSYRIQSHDGDLRLILGDDFRTDEGPDLHVVLAPVTVDEAESENAVADEATLIVALLNELTGPQTFDLPDALELTAYNTVLIHCVEFTHLYGAAPLTVDG